MGRTAAIILGALLVAGAIAVTNRWQLVAGSNFVWRLDSWSGEIVRCQRVQPEQPLSQILTAAPEPNPIIVCGVE